MVMPPLLLLLVLCTPFLSCADYTSEIQALTSFKLNLHDPLGALNGWDSSTPAAPCDWRGVSCSGEQVTELRLSRLQLDGQLTDRISDLHFLKKLSLRSNNFNNTIPSSLSKCTLLRVIFLQDNSFSCNLPSAPPFPHIIECEPLIFWCTGGRAQQKLASKFANVANFS